MQLTDKQGTVALSNGVAMPYLGLGVWQSKEGEEVIRAVTCALEAGYRHIDTASIYRNERGVGEAIKASSVPREVVFVTSKVWNADQGYDQTLRAFEESLKRLDVSYLDLYLVHWPVRAKYKETWRALETLYRSGVVKAIGVSNFLEHHLRDLATTAEITPMVNQLEFHPHLQQKKLHAYCIEHQIQYEGWGPLMQGRIFAMKPFQELADRYNRTIAQVTLRWHLQKGVVSIPKSVNCDRIRANAALFDFALSDADMALIDAMDRNERGGPDPDNFDF